MVIKDLKHEKSSVNTDTHTDEYSAALWAQGIVTSLKVQCESCDLESYLYGSNHPDCDTA